MATRTELKTLFKAAMSPVDNSTKFSAVDATDAAINALLETYNLDQASARELRAHKPEIFALMEETLEEVLPKAIDDVVGGFVETRTYGRDAEPVFEIKGVGKQRARLGIIEGARGGIYKAKRLDTKSFQVPVKVWTVKLFITLEDLLLGNYTLADLLANARDGFVEKVYISAVQALRTAKTLAPGANIDSGNGFVSATVDRLIGIANQYGNAIIMGFRPAISKINNGTGWSVNPNVSAYDVDDIRNRGFVTVYKGIPVVELPNYLADANNNQWVFKAGDMFILPATAKPVKVAMKGDLTIIEDPHPSGSVEQNIHRIMGVGLALAGNVCVYTDTDITDSNNLY